MEKQQYESDMTSREKWQKQWRTIRRLKGKDRLEYLWQYYKAVLVALVAVVLVIYTAAVMIGNAMQDTLLSIVVVDSEITSDEAAAELEQGILDIIGTGGKHDHVETVLTATSVENDENIMKLRVSLSTAGEADVVVCGESVYEEYASQGAFADMEEVLGDEYDSCAGYMTDGQVDLTKCPESFLNRYAGYSPAYLCVLSHSEHTENAAELIKAVVSGQE